MVSNAGKGLEVIDEQFEALERKVRALEERLSRDAGMAHERPPCYCHECTQLRFAGTLVWLGLRG